MKAFFSICRIIASGPRLSGSVIYLTSNKLYFLRILWFLGSLFALSACGNSNGGGGSDKGAKSVAAPVPALSFPQTLRFRGVNSETGVACETPSVSVQSRLEYCQVLKEDSTFENCARDQRDRLFEGQACSTVLAEKLGGATSTAGKGSTVLCRATEAREVDAVGVARFYGRSALAMNAQAQVVRPGAQGGRQILRSQVRSRSVVVDQVSGSGSDLKARLSIIGDAEVKASLTAHVQSGGMLTMTDFDGHQIAVECVPGTEIAASSRRAELQPHFPQVSLRASSSEISSDLKLICDGRIRKAGTPEEKLDAKEIDVLEVIDGESVILFDKHGTQVSLSVVGENSLKPYYQIRAEGLGKDSQYSFESAGELKRPQTLEVGGRQNSDNGTRVEVTCRPQK